MWQEHAATLTNDRQKSSLSSLKSRSSF